jgi:predicted MFS family arabinose efflux permease
VCENPPAFATMISLARYTSLLSLHDVRATFLASLIGRLPIGITGLSVLLLVQSSSGSFAEAGSTTASYVAGLALVAPLLGRLIDRQGPRQILATCGALYPLLLILLVGSLAWGTATWASLLFAAAAGATYPPITVSLRTFLKQRLPDASSLSTAYSLESVAIETIFIVGPMIVAFFVAAASARIAVLFAAACAAAGTFLFLRSPALKRWTHQPPRASTLFGPLSVRGFRPLLAIVLTYSLAFGLVEIGVTGFAAEGGRPALAGLLLGLMSAGSVTGGLVYGSRAWHLPINRQFALALALMGAGILPLAVLSGFWTFACFAAAAGVVMAPALTMQSILVTKTAQADSLTEAFTWSATALLAGVGLGFALGGAILQHAGSAAVLLAAAAASLSAAAGAYAVVNG